MLLSVDQDDGTELHEFTVMGRHTSLCTAGASLLSSMSCRTVRCTTAAAGVTRRGQVGRPRAVRGTRDRRRAAAPARGHVDAVVARVTARRRPR